MFFEGKIVIKKKRKKICYDVGAATIDVMCKIIENSISELKENELLKIYVINKDKD